jgi:imidazole glycerol-phosphate synthase subunit HisF
MQTKRIIPVLFIQNGLIVRSEGFTNHQIIGNVISQAHRYDEWNVDELIYVDITKDKNYDARRDDHRIKSYTSIEDIIKAVSKVCFMPLTIGGGIRNIDDIAMRIESGADKVLLNTAVSSKPDLIKEAALRFGSQAIVVSVDYRVVDKKALCYTEFGLRNTGIELSGWLEKCEELGAGEIFLHAIDRDGMSDGFDIDVISKVVSKSKLPIISCGGAGMEEDFLDVFEQTNVSAAAAGNYFHFTESSYPRLKKFLKESNVYVRS